MRMDCPAGCCHRIGLDRFDSVRGAEGVPIGKEGPIDGAPQRKVAATCSELFSIGLPLFHVEARTPFNPHDAHLCSVSARASCASHASRGGGVAKVLGLVQVECRRLTKKLPAHAASLVSPPSCLPRDATKRQDRELLPFRIISTYLLRYLTTQCALLSLLRLSVHRTYISSKAPSFPFDCSKYLPHNCGVGNVTWCLDFRACLPSFMRMPPNAARARRSCSQVWPTALTPKAETLDPGETPEAPAQTPLWGLCMPALTSFPGKSAAFTAT